MHAGFAQFAAFDQDAIDNKVFLAQGKLKMPVLAVGGEKSFGPTMATVMRFAASNVQEGIVPDSGHWIMEENPAATIEPRHRLPRPATSLARTGHPTFSADPVSNAREPLSYGRST